MVAKEMTRAEADALREQLAAHDAAEADKARQAALEPLKPLEKALRGQEKLTLDELVARLVDAQTGLAAAGERTAWAHFNAAVVGLQGVIGHGRGLLGEAAPPPASPPSP